MTKFDGGRQSSASVRSRFAYARGILVKERCYAFHVAKRGGHRQIVRSPARDQQLGCFEISPGWSTEIGTPYGEVDGLSIVGSPASSTAARDAMHGVDIGSSIEE